VVRHHAGKKQAGPISQRNQQVTKANMEMCSQLSKSPICDSEHLDIMNDILMQFAFNRLKVDCTGVDDALLRRRFSYTQQLRDEERGGGDAGAVVFKRAGSEASTALITDTNSRSQHQPSAPPPYEYSSPGAAGPASAWVAPQPSSSSLYPDAYAVEEVPEEAQPLSPARTKPGYEETHGQFWLTFLFQDVSVLERLLRDLRALRGGPRLPQRGHWQAVQIYAGRRMQDGQCHLPGHLRQV